MTGQEEYPRFISKDVYKRQKLTFRIKRGKNYKDYKFLKQQVQE